MKIMRISAVILAFVFVATPVYGQGIRLGVKGGVASSTVYGDAVDDEEVGSLTRFVGGAFVEFGIAPLLSIQPELLYSLKGGASEGVADAGELRLAYIEIPVLAKITLGGAPLRPSIFAGPAVAFNTSCEFEEVASPAVECDAIPDEDAVEPKSAEFSAIFGLGFAQSLGPVAFVVDGRYNVGLSSAFDGDDAIKNRAFTLLAGVSIPLLGL